MRPAFLKIRFNVFLVGFLEITGFFRFLVVIIVLTVFSSAFGASGASRCSWWRWSIRSLRWLWSFNNRIHFLYRISRKILFKSTTFNRNFVECRSTTTHFKHLSWLFLFLLLLKSVKYYFSLVEKGCVDHRLTLSAWFLIDPHLMIGPLRHILDILFICPFLS